MNITIVQGAFLPVPPVAGGAVEKLWFDLGREFARRGLAVTHISRLWPGLPKRSTLDGVQHRRVGGFSFPKSRVLAKLMDLVYSVRCFLTVGRSDIIVTNTFFLPLLLSLFGRRGIVYVSVHRYPQGQMKLYAKADRLQCVSTAIADAVRSQAPTVARLVKVVPNYVSTRLSEAEVAQGWAERRQEVLFVGRVHPEKGIDLLIKAFAAIDPARRAGWSLRIVGPHETAAGGGGSEFLAGLKQSAERLGLPVDWVGPIYDRDALNLAYRRARVFVYPSVAAKGEAFPLAPLEAMAQGCPVVTSDLACFSDFIRPGENADMFALDSSDVSGNLGGVIDALLNDAARQRAHSAAGLATVQNFTLERVADAFIADFASLRTP
jgi:glycosyltransferase involved in cell wall biosynthesis